MPENFYKKLAQIDVSDHVEKKGKFSYLSWAWAVDVLRQHDPSATWYVVRFDGMPYMKTECGYFVEVAVTVQGVTLSQIHPVLDNKNAPIAKPNAFQINTSIQRCLVKAIALHGLGLYIYAGEDLPTVEEPVTPISPEQVGTLKSKVLEFAELRGKTDKDVYQAMKINDVTKLNSIQADEQINKVVLWIEKAKEEKKTA